MPIQLFSALAVLTLALASTACTRVIDAEPVKPPLAPAPITAGQVGDLLSEQVTREREPNLFASADPAECAGVTREVDAPFLFDLSPAAHDGNGYYDEQTPISVWEIVAVYNGDYEPEAAVEKARRTIEDCRGRTIFTTTMERGVLNFRLRPETDPGTSNMVLWSIESDGWSCDNAFVAAHNAAIEITACEEAGGYDVRPLAEEALQRIEKLANATL